VPWYRFYYGSLVLSALNIVFLVTTFKPTSGEIFRERQQALDDARRQKSQYLRSGRSSPVNGIDMNVSASTVKVNFEDKSRSGELSIPFMYRRSLALMSHSALRRALSMPYQWAFSFFALLYCGRCATHKDDSVRSQTLTLLFAVKLQLKVS